MHHKMPEEQLNQMKYESPQFISTKDILSFKLDIEVGKTNILY